MTETTRTPAHERYLAEAEPTAEVFIGVDLSARPDMVVIQPGRRAGIAALRKRIRDLGLEKRVVIL